MGLAAQIAHQPLKCAVIFIQARRFEIVRPVERRVEIEGWFGLARRVEEGSLFDTCTGRGVRGWVEEARGISDADLDGGVYVETLCGKGDAVVAVIAVAWLEVVEPAREALQGLGTLGERDCPLVDVLRVEAVHEERFALGLDGFGGGAVGEAVLHAEDEPLDRGQDGWHVLRDP